MKRVLWRVWRVAFALLAAYLLQTTLLPYARIAGVTPDLLLAAVIALSASLCASDDGTIWRVMIGLIVGLFAALLMEAADKETPGLTSVVFALAGVAGCLLPGYVESRLHPGRWTPRGRARIMAFLPYAMIGAFALGKEALMTVYFYLRGVSIQRLHIMRVLFAGLLNFGIGMAGSRALVAWVECPANNTWFARYLRRREAAKRRRALRGIRKRVSKMPDQPQPVIKARPIDD
ncbi:MAG: hypothetical protein LBS72_02740 [Oscillospiraceae bacterium]|jgi:uncharacterized membrane protein YeaQ/YmgE (transglycosylase-associated protein family)|nr:hypothetical protein [Oscillospiraceae bacterium]